MSPIATILGVVLLTASSSADIFPTWPRYRDICLEILNGVDNDMIEFKHLIPACQGCPPSVLATRETIAKSVLCSRLVSQHNSRVASYLGSIFISHSQCMNALLFPQVYGAADWNKWAGRHCGDWYSVNHQGVVTSTDTDNALWHTVVPRVDPSVGQTFHRQNVRFETRSCCNDGWNESGGTALVGWGWDPKDTTDHSGYQGTCVAYAFTPVAPSSSYASCLIWITGEEAFLECVSHGWHGTRRSSAGFWGYGLWNIGSPQYPCLAREALPDRTGAGGLTPLEG